VDALTSGYKMTILYTQLFSAQKANEKTSLKIVSCDNTENCGAYKNSQCISNSIFGYCPYVKAQFKQTRTKRCNCYRNEYSKLKEEYEGIKYKKLKSQLVNYLCEIGDYIYIPYSYADMCALIPFIQHSQLFSSGRPFIKKEDFTAKTIVELTKFRPCALFGGEITQYQSKEVPKFLFHISVFYPELYKQATNLDHTIIDKTLKCDKIEELSCTLDKIPIGEINFRLVYCDHTAEVNLWNGETIDISFNHYCPIIFFNNVKESLFRIIYKPLPEETKVIVRDKNLIQSIIIAHPEVISS